MATLTVLIGPPGSGKSTYAKEKARISPCAIVSSDAIRKEIYGSESVQCNPKRVFALAKEQIIRFLYNDMNVIFDATNCNHRLLKAFLDDIATNCKNINYSVDAVIMYIPLTVCIERNNHRERHVPEKVIEKMHNQMIDNIKDFIHLFGQNHIDYLMWNPDRELNKPCEFERD